MVCQTGEISGMFALLVPALKVDAIRKQMTGFTMLCKEQGIWKGLLQPKLKFQT